MWESFVTTGKGPEVTVGLLDTSVKKARRLGRISALLLFLVIVLVLVILLGPSQGEERSYNRDAMVKKVLSDLVYGMRNELPGMVASCFGGHPGALGKVESFFKAVTPAPGFPLLYVDSPKISWQGAEAVVDCILVWNAVDGKGRRVSWTAKERLVLSKRDGTYVISQSGVVEHIMGTVSQRPASRILGISGKKPGHQL